MRVGRHVHRIEIATERTHRRTAAQQLIIDQIADIVNREGVHIPKLWRGVANVSVQVGIVGHVAFEVVLQLTAGNEKELSIP